MGLMGRMRGLPLARAMGVLPLPSERRVSPLTSVTGASLLATVTGDCAEAGVAHSRKQNSAAKIFFIGQRTTLPFWGGGCPSLMPALAGYFVMRQIHTREAAHRVAEALREYWTIAWTWLLFRPYARVHRLLATTAPGTMPGSNGRNAARRWSTMRCRILDILEDARCSLLYSLRGRLGRMT
jgi:hypothetical protein